MNTSTLRPSGPQNAHGAKKGARMRGKRGCGGTTALRCSSISSSGTPGSRKSAKVFNALPSCLGVDSATNP